MVRLLRDTTPRSPAILQGHIRWLLRGVDYFDEIAEWPAEMQRQAWLVVTPYVMPEWLRELPGCRPYAWWQCEAPERRRCITGLHPLDDLDRRARIERTAEAVDDPERFIAEHDELRYGVPRIWLPSDVGTEYEDETTYLTRLDLLTDEERARIPMVDSIIEQLACETGQPPDRAAERYCHEAIQAIIELFPTE